MKEIVDRRNNPVKPADEPIDSVDVEKKESE
jgi:hypothetical protein